MFQFPGFAYRSAVCRNRFRRVAPFGYPRIKGYLLLPAAFRSLSRPSSPPRAKASFMCPSLLSLCFARHAAPLSRGARRRLGAAVRRAASCKVSLALVSFEILSLSVRLSTLSFAFFKLPSCQCPRPAGRLPWGGRAGVLGFVRRSPWQS